MLRVRLLVLVLGCLLATTAAPAVAATITVDDTSDASSANACSLRQAIEDVDSPASPTGDCAAAAFGANTIVLGPNTYELGVGSFQTQPLSVAATVTTLTIQGSGAGQTTIDASQLGNTALTVAQGATVTLSDLTITSAHAPNGSTGAQGTGGIGGDGANGGAIYNQGSLTLNDAAVTDSQAGGGGVGGAGAAGAQGGDGGKGGDGGGIYNTGTLTLNGATLSDDDAGVGGAGGVGGASASGTGGAGGNGGDGGFGGALLNVGGTVTINASALSGNTSGAGGAGATGGAGTTTGGAGGQGGNGKDGGGIDSGTGSVTITNSTLASNMAGGGGAGGVGGTGGTAGGAGGTGGSGAGGGAINVFPGTLNLQSDTIAGNAVGAGATGGLGGAGPSAGQQGTAGDRGVGGGLGTLGTATVQNTLLASNSGGNCGGLTINDSGHNLSFGDSTCPLSFATGDPNLGPLADNGGPTETISLQPNSAAFDQIPPTGAGCQPTDQRGVPRPSGSACDIGAYEVAPPTAETTAATEITAAGAQLNSEVTPDAGPATTSVIFDYGTTTKYGKTKDVKGISGVVKVPADATIKGLRPGTTYHDRVVITTLDGTATGADKTFKTKPVPALSALKVKGSTASYRDSQAATTYFKLLRGRKTVASFSHRDRKGSNSVRVRGKLKRGSYVLEATPKLGGVSGRRLTVRFKVT